MVYYHHVLCYPYLIGFCCTMYMYILPQCQFPAPHENDCGPLCDYARKDDGLYTYDWLEHKTYVQNGYTTYMFNMTSQRWRPDGKIRALSHKDY